MPELPEVETVRVSLQRHLIGETITRSEILYPKMIHTSQKEFLKFTEGAKILDIGRKGKYLLFFFDNDHVMISHLRMEGKYFFLSEKEEDTPHVRVIFHLKKGKKLIYDDTRKFGTMELFPVSEYERRSSLSKIGPEPFHCDVEILHSHLKKKKTAIKTALLDQTVLAGLGNIYVDETLYACAINPFKHANTITKRECEAILKESTRILLRAIEKGGSTVSTYHPEKGVDGKFQTELNVYGKEGSKCLKCGSVLRKDICNGRGTVYCPNCQHVALRIGIYGKIASGKSTVLAYFSSKGYPVFSSDDSVKFLYHQPETKSFLVSIFGEEVLNDRGTISTAVIKHRIEKDQKLKKELENYLHPKVKKEIEKFIRKHKEKKAVFIEVPLMFESKCDRYMDYIIGVDSSFTNQLYHLRLRGSKTPDLDLKINADNRFDHYADQCDFLIHNEGSMEELKLRCDEIEELVFK